MKKMIKIGTELEPEQLAYVHGGQIIYDPQRNPYTIQIPWKQVGQAGKAVYNVAKKVWNALTSIF